MASAFDSTLQSARSGDVPALEALLADPSFFTDRLSFRNACISREWGWNNACVNVSYCAADGHKFYKILKAATDAGAVPTVRFLLEQFPARDIHVTMSQLVFTAIASGDVELVRPYVEAAPECVDACHAFYGSSIDQAFMHIRDVSRCLSMVEFLLRSGADPNNDHEESRGVPLQQAVRMSYPVVVELLERWGAEGDKLKLGWGAVYYGNSRMVMYLLKLGADANVVPSGETETPLHVAASKGHKTIVQVLLRHGADPRMRNAAGEMAVHLADRRGYSDIAEILKVSVVSDDRWRLRE
ncbi:hypothetical protein H2199_003805 [Coniosporium tulheliwenetii]|uniref:Uncharacterized protein n=1 Tax=Coniosporium tulheliwenetii TaxID=3383036 RepID=A0ACC2Z8W2_9PEZI|nr:hypothetical protein H2199_003805 [Cladosporium sp. JES 115]